MSIGLLKKYQTFFIFAKTANGVIDKFNNLYDVKWPVCSQIILYDYGIYNNIFKAILRIFL